MEPDQANLTELMNRWGHGDSAAGEELFLLINRELKKIANRQLRSDQAMRCFQPTEVVDEVFVRLAGQHSQQWANRQQFFAIVATLMSRTIADAVRYRNTKRRDNSLEVPADAFPRERFSVPSSERSPEELLQVKEELDLLDKAFAALKSENPMAHHILVQCDIEQHTLREVAKGSCISEDAAFRKRQFALAFIAERMAHLRDSVKS